MATTVAMPQLGETVTEGTVTRWLKRAGDVVAMDEALVEISTDKVDTEVPAPAAGVVLEILVPEGETVRVGTALAVIGAVDPISPPGPTTGTAAVPAPTPAVGSVAPGGPVPVHADARGRPLSPLIRRLIREHDLDVDQISGTGEGGRVTRRDVAAFIASRGTTASTQPTPTTPQVLAAPRAPAAVHPSVAPRPPAAAVSQPPAVRPAAAWELDRLRVRTGENPARAEQTAAHAWTSVQVDYERVARVRQRHQAEFKRATGFGLTYLPFVARAAAAALHDFPEVNSEYDVDRRESVLHRTVNLGIAIDVDQQGLVVGTVRDADDLRLTGLARQIRALAERARAHQMSPDDVGGSTFTITNPGSFGSFLTVPVINLPDTAILSTDGVAKRVTVVQSAEGEDAIAIRHLGYLGLTWDHRAFDGSTAVLFLQRIKEYLEAWDWQQELV